MPPGGAKSTYASVLFPPWYLAQGEAGSVLAASHAVALAERFSRKVRNLVGEHQSELGYELAGDSQAMGRWETNAGQEYYAAGVGTGIAGFRARLGIIDDPVASREQADSERSRETAWQWWQDDFSNRLTPGALELVIMTRWHEDDLAGRLLNESGSITTEVLSLPAEARANDALGRAPGEFLWEGEYGYADRLREKKETSDPRSWAAMYQQNPVPDEGLFLDVGSIVREKPPAAEAMRLFAASDYATSDGSGDYTVHIVGGLDADDRLHVLDCWRRQASTDIWVEQMIAMCKSWRLLGWAEEGGVIIKAMSPLIDRRMSQERAFVARQQFPSISDKPTRARPLQARIAQRKLVISPDAHWADVLMAELAKFPAATHDDQVDALALLCMVADKRGPPKPKVAEENFPGSSGGSFFGT